MQREIYEVTAKVIDANGTFNTLTNYPKTFDSRNYGNDLEKTYNRAKAEYHSVLGTMLSRDDRLEQVAMVIRISDGLQILFERVGKMPEVPEQTNE